jgi:acyl carrier protein
MNDLVEELKTILIDSLDLDVKPDDITGETTFFHDGLGLDSIDVLELVVAIEQRWNVRIDSRELGEQVFVSVGALADYINANRAAE